MYDTQRYRRCDAKELYVRHDTIDVLGYARHRAIALNLAEFEPAASRPLRLRSEQAPGYPARAGACTEPVEVAEEFGNPGLFIAISVYAGKMPAAG